MEKSTANYSLTEFQNLINSEKASITFTAADNALSDFGYSYKDILDDVLTLGPTDFYKSMTSNTRAGLWHDVYHKKMADTDSAYIKLQINRHNNAIVIQFKKK